MCGLKRVFQETPLTRPRSDDEVQRRYTQAVTAAVTDNHHARAARRESNNRRIHVAGMGSVGCINITLVDNDLT